MKRADPRRALPSVDAILRAGQPSDVERERFTRVAREVLARARAAHASGDAATFAAETRAALLERERLTLRSVINATGVILQTNLGRAPLAPRALAAIAAAAGAVTVEYDLVAGKRGERHGHGEGGSGHGAALWTDARNGRGSGDPTSLEPGRNPICEQSDVFFDDYGLPGGDHGHGKGEGMTKAEQAFLLAPCPAGMLAGKH